MTESKTEEGCVKICGCECTGYWIEVDGNLFNTTLCNRDMAKQIKRFIDDTVRDCCRLFREKCPACDNGHITAFAGASLECQTCGEGLRHVYFEMGVCS